MPQYQINKEKWCANGGQYTFIRQVEIENNVLCCVLCVAITDDNDNEKHMNWFRWLKSVSRAKCCEWNPKHLVLVTGDPKRREGIGSQDETSFELCTMRYKVNDELDLAVFPS